MYKNIISESISRVVFDLTGSKHDIKDIQITAPVVSEHGDYSSNIAMRLFVELQKTDSGYQVSSPLDLAERLAEALKNDNELLKIISEVNVVKPGFINFILNEYSLQETFQSVLTKREKFGESKVLEGKKYLIEHTSPNPNKAMHLGHLRNNVTGMAIANIWEAMGAEVVRDAVDNNRGIAIARLMWGYLKFGHKEGIFGNEQNFDQKKMISYWSEHKAEWKTPGDANLSPDRFVDELYVKASTDFKDESVEREVRQIVVDWEGGDVNNRDLWKQVLAYSYQGQEKTLNRLGNKWDKVWHEDEHYQEGKNIVEEGLAKNVFKIGEKGAIVTNVSKYDIPDTVVIKSDGTALYITQDLALTKLKIKEFNPDKLHWVIGPEQSLALKQMFASCEMMGIVNYDDCVHLSYGYMSIKGKGKMSSREGTVVYIDELIDNTVDRVISIMKSSDIEKENIGTVAEQIGVGAVKYSILKVGRTLDIAFDPEESVKYEGNSGPYIQYTYARTQSVLRKLKKAVDLSIDKQLPTISNIKLEDEEKALLRSYPSYSDIIEIAGENYSPNLICNYLYDLSQKYNTFYNKHRIIGSDNEELRLALTVATGQVIKNGLKLLGIQAPEKM